MCCDLFTPTKSLWIQAMFFKLFTLQKKYAVTMMEHACVDFLSQAISVDNAFLLLTQANFFDENELAQKCLEVIDKNTAKALDSDDFLAVDSQLLCSILERDTLCIREVRLFLSVLRWAKAQYHKQRRPQEGSNDGARHHKRSSLSSGALLISPSGNEPPSLLFSPPPRPSSTPLEPLSTNNSSGSHVQPPDAPNVETVEAEPPVEALREILAPILPLIRFPQMSVEEFAEFVVPSKVLEDCKAVELFLYYVSNTKPAVPYCTKSRCYLRGAEEIVRRFGAVDQRWDYRGTSDRIRFMVDRKIYVVGFGLYGSIHGQSEYEASIEIVHPESGVVLGSNDVTYLADGSANTFRVAFKEPIPLNPHVNYLASATIKGQDTYYGTRGQREIVHECTSAGKVTFRFSYAACTNNGTSVEDGQIPEIIFFV
uniref:BTB/POZ domain-containing protein 2 n=1 Tax=Schistocephalus solidus TaxID=70667 RepID=A0A0X3P012_SCHSO